MTGTSSSRNASRTTIGRYAYENQLPTFQSPGAGDVVGSTESRLSGCVGGRNPRRSTDGTGGSARAWPASKAVAPANRRTVERTRSMRGRVLVPLADRTRLGRRRSRQDFDMDAIRLRGARKLEGTIRVSGAKNAALPILCATLLSDGESLLRNVPGLQDIETTAALLGVLGRDATVSIPEVRVHAASRPPNPEAPYDLV